MKKVKVTYYTSNITVEGDSSAQDYFHATMEFGENETLADIGETICKNLEEYTFIHGDDETRYFRTNTITDFKIKVLSGNE